MREILCAFKVGTAAHTSLAFAGRLAAVLCAVVKSARSFDQHVLHVRKCRNFGIYRQIAAQLIRDDLACSGFERSTRLKKRLAELLSRRFSPKTLSHRHRIVSCLTVHRSKSGSSMSCQLNCKRKCQRLAQLMTPTGKR